MAFELRYACTIVYDHKSGSGIRILEERDYRLPGKEGSEPAINDIALTVEGDASFNSLDHFTNSIYNLAIAQVSCEKDKDDILEVLCRVLTDRSHYSIVHEPSPEMVKRYQNHRRRSLFDAIFGKEKAKPPEIRIIKRRKTK